MFAVVDTLACPALPDTVTISTPAAINRLIFVEHRAAYAYSLALSALTVLYEGLSSSKKEQRRDITQHH